MLTLAKSGCGPSRLSTSSLYRLAGESISNVFSGQMWDDPNGRDLTRVALKGGIEILATASTGDWRDQTIQSAHGVRHFPAAFFALVKTGKAKMSERWDSWDKAWKGKSTPAQQILQEYLRMLRQVQAQFSMNLAVTLPRPDQLTIAEFFKALSQFENESYLKEYIAVEMRHLSRDDPSQ